MSLRLAGSPQVPVCARNGQPDQGLTIPGTSHAEMSCIAEDFKVFLDFVFVDFLLLLIPVDTCIYTH